MSQENSTSDKRADNAGFQQIKLLLAGIPVSFYSRLEAPPFTVAHPYQTFQTDLPVEVRLEVFLTPPPNLLLEKKLFGTHTWDLYTSGSQLVFQVNNLMEFGGIGRATCVLSEDCEQGEIYLNLPDWPPDLPLALPNRFLEDMLAVLLLQKRGVLLHASGVVVDDSALLFCGMSGSGKSTMMHIWKNAPGVVVLGEERIAVRQVDGRYWAFGTSWHGRENLFGFAHAPIRRVFILRHAPENILRPLVGAEAVSEVLLRSFSPLWDPAGMAFGLQFLGEMLQVVPCAALGFVPDRRVVDFLRNS